MLLIVVVILAVYILTYFWFNAVNEEGGMEITIEIIWDSKDQWNKETLQDNAARVSTDTDGNEVQNPLENTENPKIV